MSDAVTNSTALKEAVQPSLWDRLVDDLPGVVAEMESLKEALIEATGCAGKVDQIVEEGMAALRRRTDLDEKAMRLAQSLVLRAEERGRIEARGVVVTSDTLREAVRRDIEMLFNVERLASHYLLTEREERTLISPDDILAEYPEVRTSVLNFGVPAFSGRKGSDFDKDTLSREIRDVLIAFEPRLRKDSIKVQVRYAETLGMRVDIDAILLLSPVPERLRLSTTIDLESGRASTAQVEF